MNTAKYKRGYNKYNTSSSYTWERIQYENKNYTGLLLGYYKMYIYVVIYTKSPIKPKCLQICLISATAKNN